MQAFRVSKKLKKVNINRLKRKIKKLDADETIPFLTTFSTLNTKKALQELKELKEYCKDYDVKISIRQLNHHVLSCCYYVVFYKPQIKTPR